MPLATTHAVPHVLQLPASLVRSTSQPSAGSPLQSPKPAGQLLMPQLPSLHQGVPFLPSQILPQPPQLVTSLVVLVSQPLPRSPSQSAKPSTHMIWQTEPTQ